MFNTKTKPKNKTKLFKTISSRSVFPRFARKLIQLLLFNLIIRKKTMWRGWGCVCCSKLYITLDSHTLKLSLYIIIFLIFCVFFFSSFCYNQSIAFCGSFSNGEVDFRVRGVSFNFLCFLKCICHHLLPALSRFAQWTVRVSQYERQRRNEKTITYKMSTRYGGTIFVDCGLRNRTQHETT